MFLLIRNKYFSQIGATTPSIIEEHGKTFKSFYYIFNYITIKLQVKYPLCLTRNLISIDSYLMTVLIR